jgi:propionyl-CoA carboxylase alpha chain
VRIAGAEHRVRFGPYEGGCLAHVDEGEPHDVIGQWRPGQLRFRGAIDGRVRTVAIARQGRKWRLTTRGASHVAEVLPEHVALLSRHMIEKVPPDLSRFLICPMPGLLTALRVSEGEHVEAGQPLAVVEAMKMENILRAEKAGTVRKVNAKPGESLAVDAVILEFE